MRETKGAIRMFRWLIVAVLATMQICSCSGGDAPGKDSSTGTAGGGGGGGGGGGTPPPVVPPAVGSISFTNGTDPNGPKVRVTSANANATIGNFDVVTVTGTANYNGSYTVFNVDSTGYTIATTYIADEAPVSATWQKRGGLVSGCSTTGATGSISLNYVPNRVTGVAPLLVFFDATGTTSAATLRPFHDLEYRWNFGDAGSGSWTNGSGANVSRNSALGPLGAHLFQTPGVYTVSVSAIQGSNTVSNGCLEIAVQDPAVVFAGTNTICVASASAPTAGAGGCPAGANVVQQSNFQTIISTLAASGKRILLNRGDTFTSTATVRLTADGPGIIGAYGSGAAPRLTTASDFSDAYLSFGTHNSSNTGAGGTTIKDWRVMDLVFDGGGFTNMMATAGVGAFDQITLLRLTAQNSGYGFYFDRAILDVLNSDLSFPAPHSFHHVWDQWGIVDCTTTNILSGAANSFYLAGTRMAFLGNSGNNNGAQHVVRVTYASLGVINHNTFNNPLSGRHDLKLHGPDFAGTFTIPAGSYTEKVVVSDNKMINPTTPISVDIGPQNSTSNERVRDVIFERNWSVHTATGVTTTSVVVSASNITVRDNIFDHSGVTGAQIVTVSTLGNTLIAPPTNNAIFNNTFFVGSTPAGTINGIDVQNSGLQSTGTLITNNLAYFPTSGGATFATDAGAGTVFSGNTCNASNCTTRITTNPLFASATPSQPVDFRPTAGSYAIGGGVGVPVWSDFFVATTPTSPDIGAVAH